MTFANLPLGWVLAGLGGLAAVLFALQRLRVRHREVTVVTTLFWQEAVQEARARVLTDRFRHPLAYLLILLAASLLWIGAAGPRAETDDGSDHFVLLDASAGMAWGERFADARDRLDDVVAAHPRAHTTVIVCGSRPRTVLLPGESELLLERRMEGLAPEACPETVSRTVREITARASDDRPVHVHVVGDAGPEATRDGSVRVTREPVPPRSGDNAGITGLGIADAASGAWTTVDVLVHVNGTTPPRTGDVRVTVDGAPLAASEETAPELRFRDVPANGGTLMVRLPGGDALALDDTASVVLPTRRRIRASVPDDVPPDLRVALANDPAVEIVTSGADVVVTRDPDTSTPALVLSSEREQADAFVVAGFATAFDGLGSALHELALDQVDATSLATDAGRAISLGFAFGEVPQVRVWESLLGDGFDLTRQRAFPTFVARTVRALAGAEQVIPVAAVARELPGDLAPLRGPDGATLDPAGGALAPQVAGRHTTADGHPFEIALLAAAATVGAPTIVSDDAAPTDTPAPTDLALWAGLLACGLLAAEWLLYRAERIP